MGKRGRLARCASFALTSSAKTMSRRNGAAGRLLGETDSSVTVSPSARLPAPAVLDDAADVPVPVPSSSLDFLLPNSVSISISMGASAERSSCESCTRCGADTSRARRPRSSRSRSRSSFDSDFVREPRRRRRRTSLAMFWKRFSNQYSRTKTTNELTGMGFAMSAMI